MKHPKHHVREYFPRVPPAWRPAFADYQRLLARRLVVAVALLVLVLVPGLQLIELWLGYASGAMWWMHLFLRVPLLLGALMILYMRAAYPEAAWPRSASVLFALALLSVGWTMLFWHYATGSEDIQYVSHALTLSTAAVPILATRGARDLMIIYLPPLASGLVALWWTKPETTGDAAYFAYPLVAMCIGVVISEMLFRGHVQVFTATQRFEESALTDPLTRLLNRRAMDAQLRKEQARCQRHGGTYAVVMADVDHFKRINDSFGHQVGDQVLRELATRLRDAVRLDDQVSRWGGEEFLILLPNTAADTARAVAEKILARVYRTPFGSSAGELPVTLSLGVAALQPDESTDDILRRADGALYHAKQTGRNRVSCAECAA